MFPNLGEDIGNCESYVRANKNRVLLYILESVSNFDFVLIQLDVWGLILVDGYFNKKYFVIFVNDKLGQHGST